MAKNNFYAVRKGRVPGIYTTWAEAEKQIKGFANAKHKGCTTKDEAEIFMGTKAPEIVEIPKGAIALYTDGSYNETTVVYGGGFIVLKDNIVIHEGTASGNKVEFAIERNNAGELSAVMAGMLWVMQNGYKHIVIFHDYRGVADFITDDWEAQSNCSKLYKAWVLKHKDVHIKIDYVWTRGHAGNKYNEMADKLARKAVGN